MKTAVMQPYFMPYIGYWQLIVAADNFVVYDNIEFTKKGWFNRNRILENDHDRLFTIPIKKASDYLPVNQRFLSDESDTEIARTLRIIQQNYKKAPYFAEAFPIIEDCFNYSAKNLFDYIYHSIQNICNYLEIKTNIIISSSLDIDHSLKAEKKVIVICQALQTDTYINAIGGKELYDVEEFKAQGIDLKFIRTDNIEYQQLGGAFVPSLSIIDIMMFNHKGKITEMLQGYRLE